MTWCTRLIDIMSPRTVRHDAVGAKNEAVITNGLEKKKQICDLDMHLYIYMNLVPNENADGDISGNTIGIIMMLTNQGHVHSILCNNSAL